MKALKLKTIWLIIIALDITCLLIMGYYFSWFNFTSADSVLLKYIETIRLGEVHLTARIVNKFDWTNWHSIDQLKYSEFLQSTIDVERYIDIGQIKINCKKMEGNKTSYKISVKLNNHLESGTIVLIKNKAGEWRVFADDILLHIKSSK